MADLEEKSFFDVPFTNLEQQPVQFWTKESANEIQSENNVICGPNITAYNQTKPRMKYTNKLLKELNRMGVDLSEEENSQLDLNSSGSENKACFDEAALESIASATQAALLETQMDTDDQILENWDPMKTSYEQKSFNNYQEQSYNAKFDEKHNPVQGPNGMKISPAKVDKNEIKLYISNIPLSLGEEGLQNMFGKIGPCKVKRCKPKYASSGTTYGFVSYGSVCFAETAIKDFDGFNFGGKLPLHVRLAFSKGTDQLGKERILWSGEKHSDNDWMDTPELPSDPNMTSQSSDQESKHTDEKKELNSESTKMSEFPTLYIQGLKVGTSDFELKRLFDEIGPTVDVVIVPPKKAGQITTYGFVSYNTIDEADKAIDRFHNFPYNSTLLRVCYSNATTASGGSKLNEDEIYYQSLYSEKNPFEEDQPTSNTDSLLSEKSMEQNDICSYCSTRNAIKRCSRCKTPYCNRQCQISDWPNHQVTCDLSATKCSVGSLAKTPVNVTRGNFIDVLPCREKLMGDVYLNCPVFIRDLRVSGIVICTEQLRHTEMMIKMEKQFMSSRDLLSNVSLNDVCEGLLVVAKYAKDDIGRAVVLPLSEDPSKLNYSSYVDIHFIDNGLTRQVPIKDLAHLSTEFLTLPKQCDCFLMNGFDTVPQSMHEELYVELNEYVSGKNFKVDFIGMTDKIVKLTERGSTKSLNDIFLQKIIAKDKMRDKQRNPSCSDAIRGMLVNDLPSKPFPSENEFEVCGTTVATPRLFYGQLLDNDAIETLGILTDALYIYQNEDGTPFTPNINEMCVAKFTEDGCWYRAVVLNYNEDMTARVFFVDFGNKDDVHTQNIRCIKQSLLKYPKLALKFSMYDCEPVEGMMEEEAMTYLKKSIENCRITIKYIRQDADTVICDVISNGQSLSEDLKSQGLCQGRFMISQLLKEVLTFQENETFDALGVHVVNATEFHTWIGNLESVQNQVRLISEYLSKIGDKDSAYVPVVGELCAVYDKGEWYRGEALEINSHSCMVQLIDYGKVFSKSFSHVSAIPRNEICAKPPFAHKVKIHGLSNSIESHPNVIKFVDFKRGYCTFLSQDTDVITVKWETIDGMDLASMTESAVTGSNGLTRTYQSDSFHADSSEHPIVQSPQKPLPRGEKRILLKDIPRATITSDSITVVVFNIDSPSSFQGQLYDTDLISKGDKLNAEMTKELEGESDMYTPIVGEVCAAYFINYDQYCRVKVTKVDGVDVHVTSIDYGTKNVVTLSDVAPLPKHYSQLQVLGLDFSLFNLVSTSATGWSKDCIAHFTGVCLNQAVQLVIREYTDEVIYVDASTKSIPDVSKDLICKGFAVRSPEDQGAEHEKPLSLKKYYWGDLQTVKIESKHADVMITHVESPSLFHGLIADTTVMTKLDELTVKFIEYVAASSASVVDYVPEVNEICLGFYEDVWYRVLIKSARETTVSALLLDYGDIVDISVKSIYPLPEVASTFPIQGIAMKLNDVAPIDVDWCQESIDKVKELCLKKVNIKCVSSNEGLLTVDVITGENINLADILVSNKLASPASSVAFTNQPSIAAKDRILLKDIPRATITSDSITVVVFNIDSPSSFQGQLYDTDLISKGDKLNAEMTKELEGESDMYTPIVGEVCAAYFINYDQYCRVKVTKVDGVDVHVTSIDYGTKNVVTLSDVAPLPKHYSQLQVLGLDFSLFSLVSTSATGWSKDCIAHFTGVCLNQAVQLVIREYTDEVIYVDASTKSIPDVSKDLICKGFAVRSPEDQGAEHEKPLSLKKYYWGDLQTVKIESKHADVMITHVESPSLFHGLIADTTVMTKLDELTVKFIEYVAASSASVVDYVPEVNEICLGFYEDVWYRVLIKSARETTVSALLLDYGDIVDISVKSIYPLPEVASTFPIQGIAMKLNDVAPIDVDWCQESIDKVKELCLKKVNIKCVSSNEGLLTVDVITGENINLADILVSNKLASPATSVAFTKEIPSNHVTRNDELEEIVTSKMVMDVQRISPELKSCDGLSESSYEVQEILSDCCSQFFMSSLPAPITISKESHVMVTHVESLERFYAQPCSNSIVSELYQLTVNMFDFCVCSSKDSYVPEVNSLCFGLDNEGWYRAVIKEVSTSSATAFFIDYGNERELSFSELRPFSKEFLLLPPIAIPMKLHKSEMLDGKDILQSFRCKVQDKSCAVKLIDMQNNVAHVELYTDNGENLFDVLSKTIPLSTIHCERSGDQKLDNPERSNSPVNHVDPVVPVTHVSQEVEPKSNEKSESMSSVKLSEDPSALEFVVSSFPDGVHPLESVALKMTVATLTAQPTELYVTHVVSPYMTYAVLADLKLRDEIDDISNNIDAWMSSDRVEPLIFLKSGILCSVKDHEKKWRRGIVTEVSEKEATVFAIDQGTSITCPHSEVKVLPKDLKSFPAQVIPLKLATINPKGVSPLNWSSEAIDYFRGIVDKEVIRVKQFFKQDVVSCVKMKLSSSNVMVEEVFVAGGYAEKAEATPLNPVKTSPSNPTESPRSNPVKSGIDLESVNKAIPIQSVNKKHFWALVTCALSPRLFYVQLFNEERIRKVDEIGEQIKQLYEEVASVNTETPNAGDLCALKYEDGLWYRAWVADIRSESDATFYLVDYGIKFMSSMEDVRPLPADLVNVLPAQAIAMQLQFLTPKNSEHYSKEAKDWFKKRVELNLMHFELCKTHGQICRVLMFDSADSDISEELIHKGFASSIFNSQPNKLSPRKNDIPNFRQYSPNGRGILGQPPSYNHHQRHYDEYGTYFHPGTMHYRDERPFVPSYSADPYFYGHSPRNLDRGRYPDHIRSDENPAAKKSTFGRRSTSPGTRERNEVSEKPRSIGRGKMFQSQREERPGRFFNHVANGFDSTEHGDYPSKSYRGRGYHRGHDVFHDNDNRYDNRHLNRSYPTRENGFDRNPSFGGRGTPYRGRGWRNDHF